MAWRDTFKGPQRQTELGFVFLIKGGERGGGGEKETGLSLTVNLPLLDAHSCFANCAGGGVKFVP